MEHTELLIQLYKVHSPSGREKKMRKFIKDYIKRNIPEVELTYDNVGNIYARKGVSDTYPCVVSHIDQVQEKHGHDFRVYGVDGKLFGFSPREMEMRGLGADDKNGIWVCLRVLAQYNVMKCAFFVQEEVGCVGSSSANMDFFSDCRYVLQCDRKNGGDLITSVWGDLCSKEFLGDIGYADFGYKETSGLSTDVATLKENGLKVSCVNISCGYYKPHTSEEYTVIKELDNCLAFVEHIIETCLQVYAHEWTPRARYGVYGGYDRDDDSLFGWNGWTDRSYYGGTSYGSAKKDTKSFGYQYDEKLGKYVYREKSSVNDEDSELEREIDDINDEIFDCLRGGMEDKDIITDIQYFFPNWESSVIQDMIDDMRKSYVFRQFS